MSEGRIMLLAALPLLCGGAWMLGLRRPDTAFAAVAQHGPTAVAKQVPAGGGSGDAAHDFLGVIVAGYTADVGAEVGGSVLEVFASVGSRVKAGDPLLRVAADTTSDGLRAARAKLEQQRSEVRRAEAELAEATDLLTRLQAVEAGVSDRSLVSARMREQSARASLEQARAGLGVHEADLGQEVTRSGKHTIRAPFDGLVVARFIDPGGLVTPGQVVVRVITEDAYVRFALPAEEARSQAVGSGVQVLLPGASGKLAAVISDIQPEVDSAAQLVFARARLQLDAPGAPSVLPGMRVRVVPAQVKAP